MILDVGCGHLTSHLARGQINIDRQRPVSLPENFVCCDAHVLPFASNLFDHVIFYDVIEHVENPSQVLREIARVLKPGGSVHISTPNPLHYRKFLRAARNRPLELSGSEHIAAWTDAEIKILLRNTGFTHITIRYTILPATEAYDSRRHILLDRLAFRLFPGPITGRNTIIRARAQTSKTANPTPPTSTNTDVSMFNSEQHTPQVPTE